MSRTPLEPYLCSHNNYPPSSYALLKNRYLAKTHRAHRDLPESKRMGSFFTAIRGRARTENGPTHGDIAQTRAISGMQSQRSQFVGMETLLSQLADGSFTSKFIFIEPSYDAKNDFRNGDSMHPAGDVRKGEALVKTLYEAIRGSTLWLSSMFVIVFDAGCCEPSASSGQLCARTAARKVPRPEEQGNMERSRTSTSLVRSRERPYEVFDCRYIGRNCRQRLGCSQEGAVKKGNLCNDLTSVVPERSVHRAAAVGQSCGQNGKIPAPL